MSTIDGFSVLELAWTQFWQVSLLSIVLLAVVRLTGRRRPHLTHALLLVVLVKCVTPPVWSSSTGVFCRLQTAIVEASISEDGESEFADPLPNQNAATVELLTFIPDASLAEYDSQGLQSANVVSLHEEASPFGVPPSVLAVGIFWLAGIVFTAGIGGIRLWKCLRRIRQLELPVAAEHRTVVQSLSQRLGLRREVRLRVSDSAFGPAVFGVLRPTIVLPRLIVEGRSAEQIEPIIAHELIHLRRGDLWCGLLQTLSRLVWWFHPLVYLTSRRLSREAEACCDQETIREMQYEPGAYARCLLDVLELKRQLTPVPVFPGVRPVQITSKRLEQIMQTGQGSPKRCPWWCHATFVIGAVLAIPGAEFVDGQDVRQGVLDLRSDDAVTRASAAAKPWPTIPALPVDPGPVTIRVYDATAALNVVRHQVVQDEAKSIEHLLAELRPFCGLDEQKEKGTITWVDGSFVIRASKLGHRHIEDRLSQIASSGFAQITVDAWIVSPSKKILNSLQQGWHLQEEETAPNDDLVRQAAFSAGPRKPDQLQLEKTAGLDFRATKTIQSRMPVMYQTLMPAQADALRRRLGENAKSNTMKTPRVTAFNGRQVTIFDAVMRPFVTGLKKGTPQITTIVEGLRLQLVNRVTTKDSVELKGVLTLSDIDDVETTKVFPQPGSEPVTLQQPIVRSSRLEISTSVPSGKTLLLGGVNRRRADGTNESLLVLIRPQIISDGLLTTSMPAPIAGIERVVSEKESSGKLLDRRARTAAVRSEKDAADTISLRLYPVADLVVPHPRSGLIEVRGDKVRLIGKPRSESSIEQKELIDLITSVIGSNDRKRAGGRGSIQFVPKTLSLVIRQTESAHTQIIDLLNQLRRLQELQVTLTIGLLHLPDEPAAKIGRSGQFAGSDADIVRRSRISTTGETMTTPKMTLFNGESARLRFVLSDGSALTTSILSVVSSDRRLVRITGEVAGNGRPESGFTRTINVRAGNTLMLDVTNVVRDSATGDEVDASSLSRKAKGHIYLTVVPQVVFEEEEEELLGIDIRDASTN